MHRQAHTHKPGFLRSSGPCQVNSPGRGRIRPFGTDLPQVILVDLEPLGPFRTLGMKGSGSSPVFPYCLLICEDVGLYFRLAP